MKKAVLVFLLFCEVAVFAQKSNPYLTIKPDKVIMYDFEPGGDKGGSIVEENGKLARNILKQAWLNKSTIDKLNEKLSARNSFNFGTSACFDPHLGFVYYRGDKIVGYITICLSCNRLYPSIALPAQQRPNGLAEPAAGMNKSLRKFLNGLLKQYKFSHQIEPGSPFDN